MKNIKLYNVTVTFSTVVCAEDENEAQDLILEDRESVQYILDDIQDHSLSTAKEIKSEKDLPGNWSVDSLPYGLRFEKELTVGEILKGQK